MAHTRQPVKHEIVKQFVHLHEENKIICPDKGVALGREMTDIDPLHIKINYTTVNYSTEQKVKISI